MIYLEEDQFHDFLKLLTQYLEISQIKELGYGASETVFLYKETKDISDSPYAAYVWTKVGVGPFKIFIEIKGETFVCLKRKQG